MPPEAHLLILLDFVATGRPTLHSLRIFVGIVFISKEEINAQTQRYFDMAPRVFVNFLSLVTFCLGLQEEESRTALPHALYMDISYSR